MQASVVFPSSAAWNEAIRPAIEACPADAFQAILDSAASQLTNPAISPQDIKYTETTTTTSSSTKKTSSSTKTKTNATDDVAAEGESAATAGHSAEKQQLVNIGARIILECIMAGFVPGSSTNNEDAVKTLLMTKATNPNTGLTIGGEPLQSKSHAAAVAAVWARYGKKIANAQRNRAIEALCQRTLTSSSSSASSNSSPIEKDDDANILRYVSSEVRICRYHAGAGNNNSQSNKDDLFEPFGNFAIAAENCDQQQQLQQQNSSATTASNGVLLQLSADQTYKFLCEIDAIQRKLDELRG